MICKCDLLFIFVVTIYGHFELGVYMQHAGIVDRD